MTRRTDKIVCLKNRKIVRFQFMTILESFKKASKLHAVNGLVLSLLAVLGGIFLILSAYRQDCGLRVTRELCRETIVVATVGGACLLVGIIFLVLSILLLCRLRNKPQISAISVNFPVSSRSYFKKSTGRYCELFDEEQ